MGCNKITINGEEFFFDVKGRREKFYSEYASITLGNDTTFFYKEVETSVYKRMFSFKVKEYKTPIYLFKVDYDILDPQYSKAQVSIDVRSAYKQWIEINRRKDEIANCDIINEIKL